MTNPIIEIKNTRYNVPLLAPNLLTEYNEKMKTNKTRTDDELNHIIAEWMGWIWYAPGKAPEGYPQYGWWKNPIPNNVAGFRGYIESPPSYCTNLNAMHEAWDKLIKEQHEYWKYHLRIILARDGHTHGPSNSITNATARQRAEALVSVIESEQK